MYFSKHNNSLSPRATAYLTWCSSFLSRIVTNIKFHSDYKKTLLRRLIMGDTVPELGRRPSLVASLKSKSRSLLARRSTEHESFESTGEHDYAKNIAQAYSEIYFRSDCSWSLIALGFIMTDCCLAWSWILSSLTIEQLYGAGKVPCKCFNWVTHVLASIFIYRKFAIYD